MLKKTTIVCFILYSKVLKAQGSYNWYDHNSEMDDINWTDSLYGLIIIVFIIWIFISFKNAGVVNNKKLPQDNGHEKNELFFADFYIAQFKIEGGDSIMIRASKNGYLDEIQHGFNINAWYNAWKGELYLHNMDDELVRRKISNKGKLEIVYYYEVKDKFSFTGSELIDKFSGRFEERELWDSCQNEIFKHEMYIYATGNWKYKNMMKISGEQAMVKRYNCWHQRMFGKIEYGKYCAHLNASEGDVYEGDIDVNGFHRDGEGKMIYKNGNTIYGRWRKNNIVTKLTSR